MSDDWELKIKKKEKEGIIFNDRLCIVWGRSQIQSCTLKTKLLPTPPTIFPPCRENHLADNTCYFSVLSVWCLLDTFNDLEQHRCPKLTQKLAFQCTLQLVVLFKTSISKTSCLYHCLMTYGSFCSLKVTL